MPLPTPYKLLKIILCSGAFVPTLSHSQNYYFYGNGYYEPNWLLEISPNIGVLNAVTDIGGSKTSDAGLGSYYFRKPRVSAGVTFSATKADLISFRFDFNAGSIEDFDSLLKGATYFSAVGRYERNLNFRTSLLEASVSTELHPLFFIDYNAKDRNSPRISPFILAGVGMVKFKTKGWIDEQWVPLKPLNLEGQGFEEYPDRKPYHTVIPTFLTGLGLRYELSRITSLRLEATQRWTKSDYLDDVSQENWVDPDLFYKYFTPVKALLASRLYYRRADLSPPRNTRPRGNSSNPDYYWGVQFRVGFALNRQPR